MKLIRVNETKKTYKIPAIAQAVGRTEGSIEGFMQTKYGTQKTGLTADQIEEYLLAPKQARSEVDMFEVNEILDVLKQRGWVEDPTEQLEADI